MSGGWRTRKGLPHTERVLTSASIRVEAAPNGVCPPVQADEGRRSNGKQSMSECPVRPEIAAMSGYVPGEQPQAGKFIKLNTNENPYPPSPKVIAAIEAAARSNLRRYPDPLATPFRLRAADVLGVEPDWILCGNGSDDILTITTRAFLNQIVTTQVFLN